VKKRESSAEQRRRSVERENRRRLSLLLRSSSIKKKLRLLTAAVAVQLLPFSLDIAISRDVSFDAAWSESEPKECRLLLERRGDSVGGFFSIILHRRLCSLFARRRSHASASVRSILLGGSIPLEALLRFAKRIGAEKGPLECQPGIDFRRSFRALSSAAAA
jgi:hypothetical protein